MEKRTLFFILKYFILSVFNIVVCIVNKYYSSIASLSVFFFKKKNYALITHVKAGRIVFVSFCVYFLFFLRWRLFLTIVGNQRNRW
jgi:hypothetical protein